MADNVDYNDLKRLIKIRTTRGQGGALTIPGHSNEAKALQTFEDDFFAQLVDQHQRVDLFVQSKAGEINRCLIHLDKQVGQLQQRYAPFQARKVSVRRLERYAKAEEAVERAGEEVRSLARFVGAQRLAFIKLLKKYKKWTLSSSLENRFRKKVLDRPNAFSKREFEPLLTQYNNVLAAVRARFEHSGIESHGAATLSERATEYQAKTMHGTASKGDKTAEKRGIQPSSAAGKPSDSVAARLQAACQNESNVDFDTDLASLPMGESGGKATYWVHPDNLVELHVLLLQYTRLRRVSSSCETVSAADGSRQQHRRGLTKGDGSCLMRGGGDDAGVLICDDLQRFVSRRSSAPISDTEVLLGGVPEKALATARYSSGGEAVVVVSSCLSDVAKRRTSGPFIKAKIKRKDVRQLFGSGTPTSAIDKHLRDEDVEDLRCIQKSLSGDPEVRPLVQLQCKRTRFVGLKNGNTGGFWGLLDRDISMRRIPEGFFDTKAGNLSFTDSDGGQVARFPYAVLEVRYEGSSATDLLAILDETNLTERIRGFSIGTHAVSTLCKPQGMPPPYWLPALDKDIRKLPSTVKIATSPISAKQLSPSSSTVGKASTPANSTGDGPSSSGFSLPAFESSATSVPNTPGPSVKASPKRKRRIRGDKRLRQHVAQPRPQRYWNEYDDGDEYSENEPFAIYIDPNEPTFPHASKAISSLAAHAKRASKKVGLWLRSSADATNGTPSATDDDHPYVNHVATPEDDSGHDDSLTAPLLYYTRQRPYFTFHDRHVVDDRYHHPYRGRELPLARCCVASFVASFVLLLVAAMMASAGRRKAMFEVDVGVVTGVVFSLVFAIAGVLSMLTRREDVGIAQRILVFAASAVVCIGSGGLLAGVADG